jgi:hypothetical protein
LPSHRRIRVGERLGHGHQVGLEAVSLRTEVLTEPSPGADHLVRDQQHVVAIADLADSLEVAVLRRDAATRVLQRLEDHRRDRLGALELDGLLDLIGSPERIAVCRPVVAVGVGHVNAARHEGLEDASERGDARGGERPERGAVVGDLPGDQLGLLAVPPGAVVRPGQLDGGLHRFGAAVGEEDVVEVTGCEGGDPGGQLDGAGMGVAPDRDEVELADLGGHRVAQLGTAVTRVDAEEGGEAVEVAVAVVVPDVAAVALDDDRYLVIGPERAHPREVHPEVALGLRLKVARVSLGRAWGAGRCCHPSPPFSLASPYNATQSRWAPQAELCEIRLCPLIQHVQRRLRLLGLSPLATIRSGSYAQASAAANPGLCGRAGLHGGRSGRREGDSLESATIAASPLRAAPGKATRDSRTAGVQG